MLYEHDIEKINRLNFRSCLEALSRPGELQTISPLFNSGLLAMASLLLYAEVSHFYNGNLDFELITALCGSEQEGQNEADYLFFDTIDPAPLDHAKSGSAESPELSATLIFAQGEEHQVITTTILSGPGINDHKQVNLPLGPQFIERLSEKNSQFPFGVDVFIITPNNQLIGLPRTTKIEVNT